MKTNNTTNQQSIPRRLWPAVIAASALLLAATSPALAGQGNAGNPGIAPPQSHPHGHTYGEWGALWWRWAFSIPFDQNPVADPTGEFGAVGQSGSVWFLAGTFGGSATRTLDVPTGKALFFPIINSIWVTTCIGEPRTIDDARPLVAPQIDATTVAAWIDGRPVENLEQYRAESPLFCTPLTFVGIETEEDLATTCPPGETNPNCLDLPQPEQHFGPADGWGPAMADGIWLMLAPLKPGPHTIQFTASRSDFSLDVTYHINVVPGKP